MSVFKTPFKFLDSYRKEDYAIFFGRDDETEKLYDALSGVKHLLVYGPSGAGKTSLVECGLRNQFSDADWFALTIRRHGNMIESFYEHINEHLTEKIPLRVDKKTPEDETLGFGGAIERLFEERYQPVYLLFDQFEELLIQGRKDEKEDFFKALDTLIRYKLPCRVILIMREEFIGYLSEFEPLCPSIFQHRFRLEKMNKGHVQEMLEQTLEAAQFKPFFTCADSVALATSILKRIPDDKLEIELAHVQVFLTELWQRAVLGTPTGEIPKLRTDLIQEEDQLETILDNFLKSQLRELASDFGATAPMEVLAAMISDKFTKLQMSLEDLQSELKYREVFIPENLEKLVEQLVNRKIVRSMRSGNQPEYEISHDVLALVVGRNQTEEMKLREEATRIFRVYEGKQGSFSQTDMDHMRPYARYKRYPPALEKRIQDSKKSLQAEAARIEKEKEDQLETERKLKEDAIASKEEAIASERKAIANARKARTWSYVAGVVALLSIVLAVFAGVQYRDAKRAKDTAEVARKEAVASGTKAEAALVEVTEAKEATEKQRIRADSSAQESLVQKRLAEAKTVEATEALKRAQAAEGRAREALVQVRQEQAATEAQRQKAEESFQIAQAKTKEAEASAETARKALSATQDALQNVVDLSLKEADELIYRLEHEEAIEKIKELIPLGVSRDTLSLVLMEAVYWYSETGNEVRAWNLLDTTYQLAGLPMPVRGEKDRATMHQLLRKIDNTHFEHLERRYYPQMIPILGGKFTMGSEDYGDDEKLPHQVVISPFQMAKTETTWWQYGLFAAAEKGKIMIPKDPGWGKAGDNPVVNVSWYDAISYTNWLSDRKRVARAYRETENKVEWNGPRKPGYRLPTEAEWEYAARGGQQQVYAGTDDKEKLSNYAWYGPNSGGRTQPVGKKEANPFGLYDMSGNVREWCWDEYSDRYEGQKQEDPMGSIYYNARRVVRGGHWGSDWIYCRTSYRGSYLFNDRNNIGLGFRLVFVP